MNRIKACFLLAAATLLCSASYAGQIGFEEDFAFAKDRTAVLQQLIPGTEDYYFYTCLHLQNTGKLDEVEDRKSVV